MYQRLTVGHAFGHKIQASDLPEGSVNESQTPNVSGNLILKSTFYKILTWQLCVSVCKLAPNLNAL